MRFWSILVLVLLCGCGAGIAFISQFACMNDYTDGRYENAHYTDYKIEIDKQTPKGIPVDDSYRGVDINKIDELTKEVGDCLGMSIRTCGFRVKIAPDYKDLECAGGQIFPCNTPDHKPGCQDWQCPCGCYGIVQWPSTIITTSNLASYKHELVHVVTHKDHLSPVFKCGGPVGE